MTCSQTVRKVFEAKRLSVWCHLRLTIFNPGNTCEQNMIMVNFIKVVFVFFLFLSLNVITVAPSLANEPGKEMNVSILKQWHCSGTGKVQIELKFKVTREGNIYKLKLTKGFDDPYAIRSALYAVLSAMPYKGIEPEKGTVTCTISGDKMSPLVSTTFSPTQQKNLKVELAKVPEVEKYSRQIFIRGTMEARLRKLCELLNDFPGSPEIRTEIQKICSTTELDTIRPHDWVCIARGLDRKGVIVHPSLDAENDLHATLAAYLEAWRLKHDEAVLLAMEEAWTRNVVMEIDAASKSNPLLRGNAALLTNQTKLAGEQYRLAIKDGKVQAKDILEQMKGVAVEKNLQKLVLSDKFKPKLNATAWEAILRWLPIDTETVVFCKKNAKENSIDGVLSPLSELVPIDPRYFPADEFKKYKTKHIFSEIPELYCLHAARAFKVSGEAGSRTNTGDSVEFIVLPEAYKKSANKIMMQLRQKCAGRQAVEGVEVLTFEKTPWKCMFSETEGDGFVCSPCEGVFLTGRMRYLQEILMRLRNQPNDRALPAENPEWKLVDTNATIWAVRHFDKAYIPFDLNGMYDIFGIIDQYSNMIPKEEHFPGQYTGFTFSRTGSKIIAHQLLSNVQALKSLERFWKSLFNYDGMSSPKNPPVVSNNPKTTITKNMLKVEGTLPNQSMIIVHVIMALGYNGDF